VRSRLHRERAVRVDAVARDLFPSVGDDVGRLAMYKVLGLLALARAEGLRSHCGGRHSDVGRADSSHDPRRSERHPALGQHPVGRLHQSAGGLGLHQADLVLATVRLLPDQETLDSIYLQQHDSGTWLKNDGQSFKRSSDGRPIVYAALASHELYPDAGDHPRLPNVSVINLANDVCVDHTSSPSYAAYLWDTKNAVVDVGWVANLTESLSFRWGNYRNFPTCLVGIASDDDDTVVFVQKLATGGYATSVGNDWTWTQFNTNTQPSMWASGAAIGNPVGNPGASAPTVAINNSSAIIIAYRDTSNLCRLVTGMIDAVNKALDWWNGGNGASIDMGGDDGAVPSVAMTDILVGASSVWVVVQRYNGDYFIRIGMLDEIQGTLATLRSPRGSLEK
jgi:hypothetical protein